MLKEYAYGIGTFPGRPRLRSLLFIRRKEEGDDNAPTALRAIAVRRPPAKVGANETFNEIESHLRRFQRMEAVGKSRPVIRYLKPCFRSLNLEENVRFLAAML